MKKFVFAAAALLVAAISCQEEIPQPQDTPVAPAVICRLTVDAAKGIDSKALALNGKTLNATWAEGETVAVYAGYSCTQIGTLAPTSFGTASSKLVGEIDATGLSEGSTLTLIYPGDNMSYTKQDGTLETISSRYDIAIASVEISSIDEDNVSATAAKFSNRGAIVAFSLQDATGNDLAVESLTISDDGGSLISECKTSEEGWLNVYGPVTVIPEKPSSNLTVALCLTGSQSPLCLTAEAGGKLYECFRYNVNFEAGKYYAGTVKMGEVSYTVAGNSSAIFGEEWNATLVGNDMSFADGLYSRTFTNVAKGTVVALKVVKNHEWVAENGGGSYPEGDSNNVYATAWEAGDLHVTFDPGSKEVNAWIDYYTDPGEIPTVYTIVGDSPAFGNLWYPGDTANDMIANGDGTWTKSYTGLDAGAIHFRVLKDRSWNDAYPAGYYDPYYYDVPSYGDITITYKPDAEDSEKISIEFTAQEEPGHTYTVAGIPADVFGTEWNPANTDNDMEEQTDGTFKKTYTLTAEKTDIAFKVVQDHAWDYAWPAENYTLSAGAGEFVIVFNPATEEISVTAPNPPADPEPPVEDTYTVAGDPASIFGTAWDASNTDNDMVKQSDGTYVKTYTVTTQTSISLKVLKNHDWGNAGENNWPISNVTFIADPGTLTVTFNPETKEVNCTYTEPVNITYTVAGNDENVFGTAWDPSNTANDMTRQADGNYAITYSNVAEGTSLEFKVCVEHSWDTSYGKDGGSDNATHTMSKTGNLTIHFNSLTHYVTATED